MEIILDYFYNNASTKSLDSLITESEGSILAREIDLKKKIVLGLTELEREELCKGYGGNEMIKKSQIIEKWKEKKGKCATYRELIKDACKHQQIKVAEKVREISSLDMDSEVFDTYRSYLSEAYTEESHPSKHQWPGIHHDSYVDQVLYKLNGAKESEESQGHQVPLKLDEIFDETRRVILIEGVAGSGKTTLLWHVCKQWALGKLFNQFSLMIHISLNDPALKEVNDLADFIPYPDEPLQHAVAESIIKCKGRNVCFVLDGCDEAPNSLWNGFLKKFLQNKAMLPQCTILLTSRPSTRLKQHHIPHDKVLLKGCISGDIFKIILQKNVEKRKRIERLLEMNPYLCALCDLPINAIILIFIHEMVNEENTPKTRTDLFNMLVCNFIVRHLQTRTKYEEKQIQNLDRDLPPDVKDTLNELCLLAFNASVSGKRKMSYHDLEEFGMKKPDESFGLLEIIHEKTVYGPGFYYSFPHLSIQEFLAALHIKRMRNDSKWDENKEASAIENFLNEDPLNPIITFHAGLTKLKNEKIRILLFKVADLEDFTRFEHVTSKSNDTRRLILTLLNCMYECQDENLAKEFNPRRNKFLQQYENTIVQKPEDRYKYKAISFAYLTLYPSDCLSIGYYARLILEKKEVDVIFQIDLTHCNINSLCIEAFSEEIKKVSEPVDPRIKLDLCRNFPSVTSSNRVISSVKTLLTQPPHIVDVLNLNGNVLDIPATLKSIIEALANGSSLKVLRIEDCGFNYTHIHYLILLLHIDRLEVLSLGGSNLGCAATLLSEAVRLSDQLQSLILHNCNIDDEGLNSLAQAIKESSFFIQLDISRNPKMTVSGVHKFLETIAICTLRIVHIDKILLDENNKTLIASINSIRKGPKLYVDSYRDDEHLIRGTVVNIKPSVVQR